MGQIMSPLVISYSTAGDATARQIANHLDAQIWLKSEGDGQDGKALAQSAFSAGRAIIGVCAAGILMRFVAPMLIDKQIEPAVLAVSPDGSQIVPLLGGHHGANQMASELSELLGGNAAITTASDIKLGVSLDEPPAGYVLANSGAAKPAMAELLAGEKINLIGEAPWLEQSGLVAFEGEVNVVVDHLCQNSNVLHIVPKNLVVGIGCERHCPAEHVIQLVESALAANNISPLQLQPSLLLTSSLMKPL